MELELVFNELSWERAAPGVDTARACAEAFVLTMIEAMRRGVKRSIRSNLDIQKIELAPQYHWWDWLKDPAVRRDLQRYFRSIATKYPALLDEPEIARDILGCDYFLRGERATGLGVAHLTDSLALSMLSSEIWNTPLISLEVQEAIEGEIEQRSENVRHASRWEHVRDSHSDWVRQRLASVIDNGSTLWKRSGEYFPSLIFCEAASAQMSLLPKIALASIVRGLFQLDAYAREWLSGPFDPDQVPCTVSPDSDSTMKRFAGERTFKCPDGQSRTFSWHAKVGSWRVYFDYQVGPARLLVGYVGRHLRTVKSH